MGLLIAHLAPQLEISYGVIIPLSALILLWSTNLKTDSIIYAYTYIQVIRF